MVRWVGGLRGAGLLRRRSGGENPSCRELGAGEPQPKMGPRNTRRTRITRITRMVCVHETFSWSENKKMMGSSMKWVGLLLENMGSQPRTAAPQSNASG